MSSLPDVTVPVGADVSREALSWPDRARALTVTSAEACARAGDLLKGIKDLRKKIADVFDDHIQRAFDAHRALVKEKREAEAPLVEAETILKRGMATFDQEQERVRRAEQRRLEEEARQRDEDRRLAEAAALESAAIAHQDIALMQEAEQLVTEPAPAPVVIVPSATPKQDGISYRDVWKYQLVDEKAIPREFLKVDEARLGAHVRTWKGEARIPGVRIYAERIVSAAGGR